MKQPTKAKKKLDMFSLFYGIGAAILISGILFKQLGVEFADTMFVIGLAFEIIIFLVSSVSFTSDEDAKKEYDWERVFPQLENGNSGAQGTGHAEQEMQEAMSLLRENLVAQKRLYGDISASLNDVRSSLDNLTGELDRVVPDVSSSLDDVKKQLDMSKDTAKTLSSKLKQVNTFLEH